MHGFPFQGTGGLKAGLFSENQLAVLGDTQPVDFTVMVNQDFLAPLEQKFGWNAILRRWLLSGPGWNLGGGGR